MRCPLGCPDPARPIFEKQGVPYFRCRSCRFVSARPAANPNLTNALADYEPAYLSYLAESAEDEHNQEALLRWTERVRTVTGKDVLDVGSGSGKFVRFLRRRGARARGIEPAEPLYERFLSGEPFFSHTTIEALAAESPGEQFDVIFACDVIEHVERPDAFVRDVATLLRPGGALFVSTPDVGSAFARLCGKWWHFYNRYHLSYLCRETLDALAAEAGLREVAFAHLARRKSVGYLLQYLTEFAIGRGRIRPSDRLNRAVFPINLGDTMFAAFEKPARTGAEGDERR